jgi:hypothetical protein
MVTLIIVGVLAWALKEAAEDVIRTVKGDPPPSPRKGFRGYVEDRWNALADRHHRTEESGLITQLDAWAYKRHLARRKALKRAGFKTEEDIARGAAEHRHRMSLIEQGIDPDTTPSLFPDRGKGGKPVPSEPPGEHAPLAEPDSIVEPDETETAQTSVDDHFDSIVRPWGTEFADVANGTGPAPVERPDTDDPGNDFDAIPELQGPWSPYAPTDNTNTKENSMSNNGEITGPAGVKQFHDDLKASMDGAAAIVEILAGLAYELEGRAKDAADNLAATDRAAGGMDGLGMTNAAAAARSLMEIQQTIQTALTEAAAIKDHAATILEQVGASTPHLAAIKAAYDAQTRVKDERVGAGLGNFSRDTFLDDND